MLFNLEPDRSITGGSWYSDNEFESEFVEILNQQCYRMLTQKAETAKTLAVSSCKFHLIVYLINFRFSYFCFRIQAL